MANLKPPTIRTNPALLIAGFARRYAPEAMSRIVEQWRDFAAYLDKIPSRIGRTTYGVVSGSQSDPNGVGYLSGIAVSDLTLVPSRFDRLRIPSQTFAKFAHGGKVSDIHSTVDSIWNVWLPASGYVSVDEGLLFIEFYGESFDPQSSRGDIEIWFPVKPRTAK